MFQMLKVRRARKAAVALINPLVERSRWRFHGIPELVWLDPYLIGFLGMLITLIAQREVRSIGGQALGLVQLDAWEQITGTEIVNVGEEICLLSANGDAAFQSGCVNAQQMFFAMEQERDVDAFSGDGNVSSAVDLQTTSVGQLWARYFEERVLETGGPAIEAR